MGKTARKHSSNLESFRFGSIAVFRKHVTLKQIQQALSEQVEDNVRGRPHRLLGIILREKGWITEEQERSILKEMFGEEVKK